MRIDHPQWKLHHDNWVIKKEKKEIIVELVIVGKCLQISQYCRKILYYDIPALVNSSTLNQWLVRGKWLWTLFTWLTYSTEYWMACNCLLYWVVLVIYFTGMSQAQTFLFVQATSTTTTVTARTKTTTCLETKSMISHVYVMRAVSSLSWHAKTEFSESCRWTEVTISIAVFVQRPCFGPNWVNGGPPFLLFVFVFHRDQSLHMILKSPVLHLYWNCTTEMKVSMECKLHKYGISSLISPQPELCL